MTAVAGTGWQLLLTARLERWRTLVWTVAVTAVLVGVADSMASLYPDAAKREEYRAINEASPVLRAINGPGHALDTAGGIVVFEVGGYLLVAVALMVLLGTSRLTRGEEEHGRSELALSTATGALAPLTAAILTMITAAALVGTACAVGMIAVDLPAVGAWGYGLSVLAIGVFFVGLTAIAAQVFGTGGATLGAAGIAVAVAYALRAAGDAADNGLSSASPFGWVQHTAPFADDQRWWPALMTIGIGLALCLVALAMRSRRDLESALIDRGQGSPAAGPTLRGFLTASARIALPGMVGWTISAAFLGGVFGIAGDEVTEVFASTPDIVLLLGTDQTEVTEGYLRLVLLLIALLATGYAVAALQRMRTNERTGLGELTLAASVGRIRWMASGVIPSLIGSAVILLAGAAALGGAFATVSDDSDWFSRVLRSGVWHIPAVWLIGAIGAALLGLAPKLFVISWAALGVCVVIDLLGPALQLEDAIADLSPFAHVPQLPDVDPDAGVAVMLGTAVLLVISGTLGMRRRDVG